MDAFTHGLQMSAYLYWPDCGGPVTAVGKCTLLAPDCLSTVCALLPVDQGGENDKILITLGDGNKTLTPVITGVCYHGELCTDWPAPDDR